MHYIHILGRLSSLQVWMSNEHAKLSFGRLNSPLGSYILPKVQSAVLSVDKQPDNGQIKCKHEPNAAGGF